MQRRLHHILVILSASFLLFTFFANHNPPSLAEDNQCASEAIVISIIYLPEYGRFMPQVMAEFNRTHGNDPTITNKSGKDARIICVIGKDVSSGKVMDGIIDYVQSGGKPK